MTVKINVFSVFSENTVNDEQSNRYEAIDWSLLSIDLLKKSGVRILSLA